MSVVTLEDGRKMFDLRVHIIDPKTGKVVKHQPYRKIIDGQSEVFERNGIRWTIGGECLDPEKLAKEQAAEKKAAPVSQETSDLMALLAEQQKQIAALSEKLAALTPPAPKETVTPPLSKEGMIGAPVKKETKPAIPANDVESQFT